MIAGTQFPGYGGYYLVHAQGGHVPATQEKRTVRVHGLQQVNYVLKNMPELRAVVLEVELDQLPRPGRCEQRQVESPLAPT